MSNSLPENSVERRRKVLKGALAASGVVTMGYSGSALASFNCIQKTTLVAPDSGFQLVQTIPDQYLGWNWVTVTVSAAPGDTQGLQPGWFTYLGVSYSVTLNRLGDSWSASTDPVYATTTPPDNPTQVNMSLLVLYDTSGASYVPVAPSPYVAGPAASPGDNLPATMPQPITGSCHTSLNPGVGGGGLTGG